MSSGSLRIAFGAVSILTVATVALVVAIAWTTGVDSHGYLLWNLVLAWIPLLFAVALGWARRLQLGGLALVALGAGWLLFLPNAPYMVTDLVHLQDKHYTGRSGSTSRRSSSPLRPVGSPASCPSSSCSGRSASGSGRCSRGV